MFELAHIGAMRRELEKLATQGHGPPTQEYEELTHPRLMQALKDFPVALLGTGLGYAAGRTGAEYLMPQIFQSQASQEALKRNIGIAGAAAGGLGSYFLAHQQRMMKQRRDEAQKKDDASKAVPVASAPASTPQEQPKMGGAVVPAVAQARRIDPWREDRRYPKFLG